MEAVRDGVETAGWELSGLQKTTSHHFEGRWEGDSTRSAYLFFHHPRRWKGASVDVYLDETSKGLRGNLALVLDGRPVDVTGEVPRTLPALGRVAARVLPDGYRTPVTLRFRLKDGEEDVDGSDVEIRVKIHIPGSAMEAGSSAVSALASAVVDAFEELLDEDDLLRYADPG